VDQSDLKKLARQFMRNAVQVRAGDNVWIEYRGPKAHPLAQACSADVLAAGATPHMVDSGSAAINAEVGPMSAEQIAAFGVALLERMKTMQGYIRIDDDADQSKLTLSDDVRTLYKQAIGPMTAHRVNTTRWLVTVAPTEEFAAACGMTFPQFEEFYRDVCLIDYGTMTEAVKPLERLMTVGKTCRIVSPKQETDLTMSIDGIGATPCTGANNIPDGECFTAPVRDSVNGTIKFGPSNYDGQRFAFIKLTFKNGRIETAEAENAERTAMLNQMLDTDPGARYIGEFSLNFNPYVKHPTGSILFDEKIDGGIHMAAGRAYEGITDNGNRSAVHWDMVHIQRPDYGGGEVWIDGQLIRKDGRFVLPELEGLNPEQLAAATEKAGA